MRLKRIVLLVLLISINSITASSVYKSVYNEIPIINSITKNKNQEYQKSRYVKMEHLRYLERYNEYIFEKKSLILKNILNELPWKDKRRVKAAKEYEELLAKRIVQKKLFFTRMKNY